MIQFKVFGIPVSQPRVKATVRGSHAGVYTPTKTASGKSNGVAEFKAALKQEAGRHHTGPLLTGPLQVDVCCVFPRETNKVWKTKPMPRYRHTSKPDRDNLDKCVLDALTGVLWVDDNQVCCGSVQKWRCAGDEAPHTLVTVIELDA